MRYDIRFYDARADVKLSVELVAVDRYAAEVAARLYLLDLQRTTRAGSGLLLGAVREIPS